MDTPLTREARRLYEETVVPVREIARLAGVSERTLYKYVQRGGWRRRYRRLVRGAESPFVARAAESPFVARSAGGRFMRREDASAPHAAGLKALDPAAGAVAAAACVEAGAVSDVAVVEASAAAQARADMRSFDILCTTLIDLAKMRKTRKEGALPRADRLDARLQDAILAQMSALIASQAIDL
ncbi:MAG: hypothetical protein ACRECO_06195 [Xanthobacteraceae bacterium]